MTRVSPPDEALEFPAPHASTSVTRIPARRSVSAVHPPNAPAPTTTTWSAASRRAPNRSTNGAATADATNLRRVRLPVVEDLSVSIGLAAGGGRLAAGQGAFYGCGGFLCANSIIPAQSPLASRPPPRQ